MTPPPFGTFPKNHHFWRRRPSLSLLTENTKKTYPNTKYDLPKSKYLQTTLFCRKTINALLGVPFQASMCAGVQKVTNKRHVIERQMSWWEKIYVAIFLPCRKNALHFLIMAIFPNGNCPIPGSSNSARNLVRMYFSKMCFCKHSYKEYPA